LNEYVFANHTKYLQCLQLNSFIAMPADTPYDTGIAAYPLVGLSSMISSLCEHLF